MNAFKIKKAVDKKIPVQIADNPYEKTFLQILNPRHPAGKRLRKVYRLLSYFRSSKVPHDSRKRVG